MNAKLCPVIDSPCQSLPAFTRGQKVAFCALCQKNVHNFSALADQEQRTLLQSGKEFCVRYALVIPALVIGTISPVLAQDGDVPDELEPIQIMGGRIRGAELEEVFLSSEIDEQFDESDIEEKPR